MNNVQQKAFFQSCLYEALMRLMGEKPFEKISVGELCQVAGVSRMTYYRSYASKEDILLQHLDECFHLFLSNMPAHDFYGTALSFFAFWQGQERAFLVAVVRSGLSERLMDRFCGYLDQIIPQMTGGQKAQPFVASFFAGGLYKMLVDWIADDTSVPPEKMAAFLADGSAALASLSTS